MEIEFDPTKDAINIAKHGLSLAEGRCLVFTWNLEKIRVISFRRAREKEMRRYE